MPPVASKYCCCVCGKKSRTHPGLKLHVFPRDARRRLQWLKTLNIAYVKNTQSICEDHFEPQYISSSGRLLNNAVPIPTDGSGEETSQEYLEPLLHRTDVAEGEGSSSSITLNLPLYDPLDSDFGRLPNPLMSPQPQLPPPQPSLPQPPMPQPPQLQPSPPQPPPPQAPMPQPSLPQTALPQPPIPLSPQLQQVDGVSQELLLPSPIVPQRQVMSSAEDDVTQSITEGQQNGQVKVCPKKRTPITKLLRNTIRRLRKQVAKMGREAVRTPKQLMAKAAEFLPPQLVEFFRGQITKAITSKKGRRFGVQERRFALGVYYHSPKTYRYLCSVFMLPSISTLHLWLRKIVFNIGWSKQTLAVLKRKSEAMPKEERLCGITFDAMSIKESLHFDKASDSVIGREDFGEHGSSLKPANHALVFMIKGLVKKWKMVLGCFFYSGGINTNKMKELYDTAIQKVQATGYRVMFTVCDQEGVHRSLFQTLGMTKENPSFIVNGERLHYFYDSPHLLKSLRNTVKKYKLNIGGNIISWDHVVKFFLKDHDQKIRLAPKLTKKHMCEEGFSKMRVSLAAQVMSRTVAAGIYTHAIAGLLPQEAVHTAEFVYQVDRLFDCFNSAVPFHFKDVRGGISVKSCHMEFIKSITKYIKSWEVCAPPHVHIHCIDGWLINLASLQALWQDLQSCRVKYLLTRRLNQDCLENLFARLRNKFGNCDHPSMYNFMKGLKSIMTHDLFSVPSSGNCEADDSQFLDLISNWQSDDPIATTSDCDSDSEDAVVDSLPLTEMNALLYLVGWTCKIFLKDHDCPVCRDNLLDVNHKLDSSCKLFCFFKAESKNKEQAFGGLSIPTENVVDHFSEVETLLRGKLEKALLGKRVTQKLLASIEGHIFVYPLQLCSSHLTKRIHLKYIEVRATSTVKWTSREARSVNIRKNKKLVKLNH